MLDLIRWALALILPARGSRRAEAATPAAAPDEQTMIIRAVRRRKPEPPVFVDHLPLVRPYLVAWEQSERRRKLLLAAEYGVDVDTHLIGAAA